MIIFYCFKNWYFPRRQELEAILIELFLGSNGVKNLLLWQFTVDYFWGSEWHSFGNSRRSKFWTLRDDMVTRCACLKWPTWRGVPQFGGREARRVWGVRRMKVVTVSTLVLCLTGVWAGRHERRLLNDLFLHYDKRERPVWNESETVQMTFAVE